MLVAAHEMFLEHGLLAKNCGGCYLGPGSPHLGGKDDAHVQLEQVHRAGGTVSGVRSPERAGPSRGRRHSRLWVRD